MKPTLCVALLHFSLFTFDEERQKGGYERVVHLKPGDKFMLLRQIDEGYGAVGALVLTCHPLAIGVFRMFYVSGEVQVEKVTTPYFREVGP